MTDKLSPGSYGKLKYGTVGSVNTKAFISTALATFRQILCFVDRESRYIDIIKTNLIHYLSSVYFVNRGFAVAQWLRCCATNRKVAGSIPAGVNEIFVDIKSFRSHGGPVVDTASNINE